MATEDNQVSTGCDESFLIQASIIAESLANLIFLICEDAHKPDMVMSYGNQAEARLQDLVRLLQTAAEKKPAM